MDGKYRNNKEKYLTKLRNWKNKIIRDKSWKNHAHLHIDDISKDFKDSRLWLSSGLFLYNCLREMINLCEYDCILSISLKLSSFPMITENLKVLNIEKEMDNENPPSLYLFPIGEKDFEETIQESTLLEEISIKLKKHVYFKEEWNEDFGYIRTIFIRN